MWERQGYQNITLCSYSKKFNEQRKNRRLIFAATAVSITFLRFQQARAQWLLYVRDYWPYNTL